jgi:hypothetical protein
MAIAHRPLIEVIDVVDHLFSLMDLHNTEDKVNLARHNRVNQTSRSQLSSLVMHHYRFSRSRRPPPKLPRIVTFVVCAIMDTCHAESIIRLKSHSKYYETSTFENFF